jgi:hypothetical protein
MGSDLSRLLKKSANKKGVKGTDKIIKIFLNAISLIIPYHSSFHLTPSLKNQEQYLQYPGCCTIIFIVCSYSKNIIIALDRTVGIIYIY